MPRLAMPCRGLRAASLRGLSVASAWLAWGPLVTRGLGCLCRALCSLCALVLYPWKRPGDASVLLPEPWEGCPERRIYRGGDAEAELLTVYTKPCSFQVDLAWLAAESAYFKALSRSRMQEAAGGQLHLDHVPSGAFHAILQWVFLGRFSLAEEELLPAVQAASYLLLPRFLDRCWEALRPLLGPQNCFSYLHFAEAVGCPELRAEVCRYLSAHLLELARPVTHQLAPQMKEELARLRLDGPPRLCVLQKENRRRHFSTAVVGHHIYAIGGWYLDSLLAPDSSTCLYTAVERYDPWTDSWAFVSSLPMGDFSFTISLSHDLPLCTAHAGSIYTLGTVQRTGEKLLLCYDVATDTWQELLPTLTRADADLPGLYFLGGTEPLFVVGSSSRDNVVTSFSVASHQWGPVRSLPKCSLAGQGLVWEGLLYMASPDLGAILQADLSRPACWLLLPPPPFPLCYEALFLLHFPQAATTGERAAEQGEEDPQR
ncbi:kelch repeat and BTB domain-containing protein 11-like isoform X2 [Eublepharis macularius]|uniref:Kelch repeat and BTB domain-containing protein 11-like isoform X2 n=1 Tax=Eublepharis macularius TaxID=481883 RepID=A0AA97L679_EUBMA|nr:kelch repeat and BTB domain-containing protein 11-like isoform X2 [Eublepharis macularius]